MSSAAYRIVTRKGKLINGVTGWDWEIWDTATDKIKTQGWSAGKKSDAEEDAELWIERFESRQTAQERARRRGGVKP